MISTRSVSRIFLVVLLALAVFSCKEEEKEITIYDYWQFVSLESKNADPPVFNQIPEDLEIKVLFDPWGRVMVESYCNSGSGDFSEQGASLEIKNLAMTEKSCSINEPLDWEAIFVFNFTRSDYYLIEDKRLTILTGGDYHLNFKKINY